MSAAKGYANVRTVTLPRAMFWYLLVLAFAGLVALMLLGSCGVYFGTVLATRPDVPLLAPPPAPVKATK
jgi:hypothetical protein